MAATAGQQQLLAVVERVDIWHCVAAYLGGVDMWRARRVCLGFRAACEAELRVLRELSLLTCCHQNVTDAVLRTVAMRCPQLRSLDLSKCLRVTGEGVRALQQRGCTVDLP
jgi:hypothetical protein